MSAACSALLRNWTKTWMRKATPTPANATKIIVVMTCPSSRLPSGRNIDFVGCYKLSVWHFGLQFDPVEAGLLLSLGEEREQVLVIQFVRQVLQVRCEGDRGLEALEIGLAAGLISEPREVILSPVEPPEAVPEMTRTSGVDGIDEDPCSLSMLDRRIHIWVRRSAVEPVDAIGDHQNLVARDRKSTRLNSSHVRISYAVFCLK